MHLTAAQRKRIDEGDTKEMVITFFEDAQKRSGYSCRSATPQFSLPDVELAFNKHFNSCVIPVWISAECTVHGALTRALQNLSNVDARIVSLYAIHDLLRMMEHRHEPDLAGFNEIYETLLQRRNGFTINALMFAGMIGGQVQADVVRSVARDRCHKENSDGCEYSLVQYLTEDGMVPGSWSSTQEMALRNDIKAKYNALKEVK
jgi:hypothetical protein